MVLSDRRPSNRIRKRSDLRPVSVHRADRVVDHVPKRYEAVVDRLGGAIRTAREQQKEVKLVSKVV